MGSYGKKRTLKNIILQLIIQQIMDAINKNYSLQKYILICFSLFLTFCLISIYEVSSLLLSGKEVENFFKLILFKWLNHFYTLLFIFLAFLPFYFLLVKKKLKHGVLFVKIVFVVLIIIEFSLTKYSLTTLLNLGADLLGYSLDDIFLTVSSSESVSFLGYLPFLIFPILFLISCFFLRKSSLSKHFARLFIAIAFLILIVKFALPDFSRDIYQNKTYYFVSDVVAVQIEKNDINEIRREGGKEYPLLQSSTNFDDVLSPFFNLKTEKPNIVVILVEGLGSEFINNKQFSGFTPYIDSLISESLFWDNFLSNTGRTFGALPSFMGSVPYGEKGFLEIEEMPSHYSLFSILSSNGYSTSFFSGDQSSFDKKINFLEFNGVQNIIDENKYESFYPKAVNGDSGFSWGFSDYEIFKKTLATLDDIPQPRFDLITTQTIHEPFEFPLQEQFTKKIDSILASNTKLNVSDKQISSYKDIFATILYADYSLKMFMESYKKRKDYENTIFIISGDHRVIPIAQKDKLCRFNVPFIIYSPLLKETRKMKSVNSHFDVAPTLLAMLSKNYEVSLPKEVAWLGEGIDTAKTFRNVHDIPLMRYKGTINDYVYKDFLYSDGTLYQIKQDFNTVQVSNNEVLDTIKNRLKEFKNINAYVTKNNKIIRENTGEINIQRVQFTDDEMAVLKKLTEGLNPDQVFQLAREKAFNNKRDTARLICNYILKTTPNYIDVRILKGRTLAWDKQYEEAESELLNALKRSPYYYDIYLALLDVYWWSSQNEKAIELGKKAQERGVKNDDIAFKLARSYRTLNEKDKALQIMDSIIKKNPKNNEYINFKNTL